MGRHAAAWALAAILAGCAAPPPPPAPVVEAVPLPPPGVDGRYRGTVRLVRAENNFCPRSGPRTLEVSDGRITLSYSVPPRQRVPLIADIQADGRVMAEDGEGRLEGQVSDGRLEVTITSGMCEHRWTMTRMG